MSSPCVGMLFDPRRPQHPEPALMPHFLDIFNTHYAHAFPFLSTEQMSVNIQEGKSHSVLECAVAALAARYFFHVVSSTRTNECSDTHCRRPSSHAGPRPPLRRTHTRLKCARCLICSVHKLTPRLGAVTARKQVLASCLRSPRNDPARFR